MARTFPGPPRRGGAALRSALRADVGVLPRLLRNGLSRGRYGRVPDPDGQAQGSRTGDARLHRARRSALAWDRGRLFHAAATRRRIALGGGAPQAARQAAWTLLSIVR